MGGCSSGKVLITSNGLHGAGERLATQTVSVQAADESSLMSVRARDATITALREAEWHPVAGKSAIIMSVMMRHGGYGTVDRVAFGPVFSPLGG